MATVRELQARFVATAKGLRSTIQGIKKDIDGLQKNSSKTSGRMSKDFAKSSSNINKSTSSIGDRFQRMGVVAQRSFENIGKTMRTTGKNLQSFGTNIRNTGESLNRNITKPATIAAGAIAGITIGKGLSRLVGIDSARAKLTGLGHDAEGVETIMNSALDSVKGTAFGMDEAATTAASAVAAGIEPGKELTRYLSLTGDAAAIAGINLGEMGSIINQVQTSGVAYTDNLNQLADRGIPIYQWLGEEAGVAASEVKELASEGKISSEMLLNAIEDNIGGAAKTIGEESFTAAIDNMWAAVGRLGASFLDGGEKGEGFFSQLKPLINDFTDQIDNLDGVASAAGEKFGEMFANFIEKVKEIKAAYDELSPTVQNIINKVALIGGAVTVGLGPLLTGFGLVAGVVGKAMTGFGGFFSVISKVLKPLTNVGSKVGLLSRSFTFLTGPVGIVIGIITTLVGTFIYAYRESETFRDIVNNAFEKVKEVATNVFGAVSDFIKEKIAQVKSFWDTEGQQFLQAWQNVWSGISSVVSPIIDGIVAIAQWAFPHLVTIIRGSLTIALEIVKSIWSNIQGVIDGGLKIIQGLIQVFSGLFTGDFSKMWEGIKNIFSGAIQFLWNFIQLMFWGRLIKGVVGFARSFSSFFSSMWQGIRDIFNRVITWIVNFVRNSWNSMRNTTTSVFNAINSFISRVWNGILTFFRNVISNIFNAVRNGFNNVRNTTTSIFNRVRSFISNVWNNIRNNISTAVQNIFNRVRNTWTNLRNRTTEIFNDIKDRVKGVFDDIVGFAKDLPGRIGDGIKNMAGKVKDGVQSVARNMVDALKAGIDGIIDGINWVMKKLNVDTRLDPWTPSWAWYADGTDSHPGGPAVVGDGTGSNAGSELVLTPDGRQFMSPDTPTLVDLPRGTQVLSAKNTRKLLKSLPMYENGKGILNSAIDAGKGAINWGKEKVTGAIDTVKGWAGTVWDYVTEPSKLLDMALDALGIELPSLGIFGDIARGGFNFIKDGAIEFIKGKIDDFLGDSGEPVGAGVERWRPTVMKALAMTGLPVTSAYINAWLRQIKTESGGNPRAVQSTAVKDINYYTGNLARGLVQVIPPTFRAFAMPGFNDPFNGLHSLLAGMRYAKSRYGIAGMLRAIGQGRGYADGGIVSSKQLAWIAEGGWAESIISHDPAKRASQQRIWQQTGDMLGFTDNKEALSLLKRIANAIESGDSQIIAVLMELLRKPVISEGDIKRAYDKIDTIQYTNQRIMSGKTGGA